MAAEEDPGSDVGELVEALAASEPVEAEAGSEAVEAGPAWQPGGSHCSGSLCPAWI